ncbi:SET MYND domain-containing protein [Fusarium globosum]|uniref:SET MYND domain-containing protein n=1 Tax=Fusarium globosum TaxID=78864 RepID=A0A8H5YIN2_9HYPO|nr:SET MYND domain-containing protein [Fusarium globosum]
MATSSLPCANCSPDGTSFQNAGKSGCANCRLVVYCSSECQKAHWPLHKVHCKSPMNSENWRPEWVVQKRIPSFVPNNEVPTSSSFGGDSWLWGSVPALDVLKLDANEGESYKGKLSLLFAASGDIRNVVKTIAQLPLGWDQPIDITMNDIDFSVVARNAIILLITFTAGDENEAIDCIIHIWYSSSIRKSDHAILEERIRPLIQTVCDKIKSKPADRVLGKTWTFGKRSLRLVLTKAAWDKLLSYATIPEGLTMERANQIRKAVTLAESHFDFLERHYLCAIPSHRVPQQRYREDGILQPFGAQRSEVTILNPTFFQPPFHWPIPGGLDPRDGWSPKDLEDTDNGPATSDIYGKLLTHLRFMLKSFMSRIANTNISFQLLNIEATKLLDQLEEGSFDRIEVSNISDSVHLGPHLTVLVMSPLL